MTNKGKMIEAVYAACLTKRATLVIFYLINRANQELICFPSVGTIARECNMSTRTVQRALKDLEEAGFLERESRFHERGGQRSNMFYIKIMDTFGEKQEIEEIDFRNHITLENSSMLIDIPIQKKMHSKEVSQREIDESKLSLSEEGNFSYKITLKTHIINKLIAIKSNVFDKCHRVYDRLTPLELYPLTLGILKKK